MRRNTKQGMTLVEMLVVMAIIALLAGIAVPVFMRSGAFAKDEVGGAARTLYTELVAARHYAARYRVETAVVYAMKKKQDTYYGTDEVYIAGTATARQMTPEEYAVIEPTFSVPLTTEEQASLFVLLRDHHGQFGFLGEYAGVAYDPTLDGTVDHTTATPDEEGMEKIRLYQYENDVDLALVQPFRDDGSAPIAFGGYASSTDYDRVELYENFRFPGHVFQPNGMIRTGAPKERFMLDVAATPDAFVEDRYIVDADGNPTGPRLPRQIEMFKSTGRVKINS